MYNIHTQTNAIVYYYTYILEFKTNYLLVRATLLAYGRSEMCLLLFVIIF